jgi:mono/diheme cytochrome c family protein
MSADTYHILSKIHWISVLLFLGLYIYKLILLITNKIGNLDNFSKKFRIPESIISLVFLVTGFILLINTGNTSNFLWIKIILVFASIPVGIIGFKKHNKIMAVLCVLLIVAGYGMAEANKSVSKKQLRAVLQNLPNPKVETNISKDSTQTEQHQKQQLEYGKQLYTAACINCHGENGDLGKSGAKNLKTTALNETEKSAIIKKGKGVMPSYSSLSDTQIQAIIKYINTLKK